MLTSTFSLVTSCKGQMSQTARKHLCEFAELLPVNLLFGNSKLQPQILQVSVELDQDPWWSVILKIA